jgi:hypothetical protein
VGGQCHAAAALPPGKTLCPLYRRLGGPRGRSGQVRKISPPPGFNPQTVQFVVSRYTDRAILAYWNYSVLILNSFIFWNVSTTWSVLDSMTLEKGSLTCIKGWLSYGYWLRDCYFLENNSAPHSLLDILQNTASHTLWMLNCTLID